MRASTVIALGAVYVTVAFLIPVALHVRRTGESPLRLGPVGPADAVSKVLQGLGLAGAVATPMAHLGGLPLLVDWRPTAVAGTVVMVAGILLTAWAQQVMGKSWRIGVDPGERTALVVRGPFRLIRNPVYTGVGTAALGLALLIPNVVALATCAAAVAGLQVLVRAVEEPYLEGVHGEAYRSYAARTGRFIPFVGRGLGRGA